MLERGCISLYLTQICFFYKYCTIFRSILMSTKPENNPKMKKMEHSLLLFFETIHWTFLKWLFLCSTNSFHLSWEVSNSKKEHLRCQDSFHCAASHLFNIVTAIVNIPSFYLTFTLVWYAQRSFKYSESQLPLITVSIHWWKEWSHCTVIPKQRFKSNELKISWCEVSFILLRS